VHADRNSSSEQVLQHRSSAGLRVDRGHEAANKPLQEVDPVPRRGDSEQAGDSGPLGVVSLLQHDFGQVLPKGRADNGAKQRLETHPEHDFARTAELPVREDLIRRAQVHQVPGGHEPGPLPSENLELDQVHHDLASKTKVKHNCRFPRESEASLSERPSARLRTVHA